MLMVKQNMPQCQSLISCIYIILTSFVCNKLVPMFDVNIMLVDDDVDKWVKLEVTSSCNLVLVATLGISVLGALRAPPWNSTASDFEAWKCHIWQIYWILHQVMRCILFWTNNKMCWDHPPRFITQKILIQKCSLIFTINRWGQIAGRTCEGRKCISSVKGKNCTGCKKVMRISADDAACTS